MKSSILWHMDPLMIGFFAKVSLYPLIMESIKEDKNFTAHTPEKNNKILSYGNHYILQ